MKIIADCYLKQSKAFPVALESAVKTDLALIDEYTETVTDALLDFGLQPDCEPNAYGLLLEKTISYLCALRYDLIDE